jgi:Zn-finger protein
MTPTYYIYFYVFECEHCHYPHLDTRLVPTIPQDQMDNDPYVWTCKKCKIPQSAVGYRTAAYAKKLLMTNGKCTERVKLSSLLPTSMMSFGRARRSNLK